MSHEEIIGKPDAGNPHVPVVDQGEYRLMDKPEVRMSTGVPDAP